MSLRLRAIWSWCFAPVQRLLTVIGLQAPGDVVDDVQDNNAVSAAIDSHRFSSNGGALADLQAAKLDSQKLTPSPKRALARDVEITNLPYGAAAINWIYLASISKWGRLANNHPVAVLFFEFHFDQPQGYELDRAEFELALHPFSTDPISPQIRQCAPVDLRGVPHTEVISSRVQIVPQIQVKDVAISGMGTERGSQWSVDHRWRLEGSRRSDPKRRATGELTKAKWKYSPCKLSKDVDHPHTFRTGCVVDFLVPEADSKEHLVSKLHDLTVDVDISGKLHSRAKIMKKFEFKFSKRVGAPPIEGYVIPSDKDAGNLKDEFESFVQKIEKSNQNL